MNSEKENIMNNKLTREITKLTAKKIRGVISIYNFDGYFYIDIIDNNNFVWRYLLEDIGMNISLMKKAKLVSSAIVIAYRKYINNRYFY